MLTFTLRNYQSRKDAYNILSHLTRCAATQVMQGNTCQHLDCDIPQQLRINTWVKLNKGG